MAAEQKLCPNVYMFREDQDLIKELVCGRSGREISGELFGLWTEDGEPVVHLVTVQAGREKQQPGERSTSFKIDDSLTLEIRKSLYRKFHLNIIGKWLYEQDTEQNRNVRAEDVRADETLFRPNSNGFLLMMVNYKQSASTVELSPYLLSESTISTVGTLGTLNGENIFKNVKEIREIIGDRLVQVSGCKKSESDAEMNKGLALSDEMGGNIPLQTRWRVTESENFDAKNAAIPRPQPEYARHQTNDLKVYMFEEDRRMMEELVLQYPDVETGGDLFGLWTTDGDAVLHIVLGPGKNCSRTNVSFNQDIPYLQRNGELLTEKYMLGHIGEWHSHHQLRLFQPSHGDSSTVIRHFPSGSKYGFLLIIANITARDKVMLSPYLYTEKSAFTYDKTGEVISLRMPNAFKKTTEIRNAIEHGKETELDVQQRRMQRPQHYSTSMEMGHRQVPRIIHAKAHVSKVEPMDVDKTTPGRCSPTNKRSTKSQKDASIDKPPWRN